MSLRLLSFALVVLAVSPALVSCDEILSQRDAWDCDCDARLTYGEWVSNQEFEDSVCTSFFQGDNVAERSARWACVANFADADEAECTCECRRVGTCEDEDDEEVYGF